MALGCGVGMRVGKVCGLVGLLVLLAGCDDGPAGMQCPGYGRSFFDASINGYVQRHGRGDYAFELLGEAQYDAKLSWWRVPFEWKGREWQALVSCDGHLEVSGG